MSLHESIVFNGIELASHIPGSHITDINVGSIETEHVASARITRAGSLFSHKRDATRSISISVELPLDDREGIMRNYNLLRMWAESDQPKPLYLPDHDGYIHCILDSMSELNIRTWYEPIEVTFIAYDPYFYGTERKSDIGENFLVSGDVSVPFEIECTLENAVESPSWLIDDAFTIALTGTVGAGTLVIDTERGLVTLNGDSINDQISLATRFNELSPGVHTITGFSGSVIWIERWK